MTKLKLQGSGVRVNSVSSGLLPISSLVALDGTGNQNTSSVTQVWTYFDRTGKNELKTVNHVFKNQDPEITLLILESKKGSSELITTTPEHPFYVSSMVENAKVVGPQQPSRPKPLGHADLNVHWVGAGHVLELRRHLSGQFRLEIGDKIRTADGSSGIVLAVLTVVQPRVMYNLEVQDNDDFFVGENGWLVHNASSPNTSYTIKPSQAGLNIIEKHLSGEYAAIFNDAMIERLRDALKNGNKLTGADANFYLHEIYEDKLMSKGIAYKPAHDASLERYGHVEFDLYHPDVIKALSREFYTPWFEHWGIKC